MKSKLIHLTLALCFPVAALAQDAPLDGKKPSIVFILMDNLGYGEGGSPRGREVTHLEDRLLRRSAGLVDAADQARRAEDFDLINDPKEEYPATATPNAWVGEPMMKILADFEESLKKHAPIRPGTLDPYRPVE
jgi:hypothetical protein